MVICASLNENVHASVTKCKTRMFSNRSESGYVAFTIPKLRSWVITAIFVFAVTRRFILAIFAFAIDALDTIVIEVEQS